MDTNYIIETKNLTKQYGSQKSVADLNIHVKRGRIYGLLGRNGAGKTTTMKMLLGLTKPTSGEVKIWGKPLQGNEKKLLPRIGSLIESPAGYLHLTAQENLEIVADLKGVPHKDIGRVLDIVHLTQDRNRRVGQYSLGMKQRLGIAMALLGSPKLLILDEPTNHLDMKTKDILKQALLDFDGTLIVVSHDRYFLNKVCTQIADIDYGKIQLYAGNYDFWFESSQLLVKQMKEANKKKEEKIKELQEFIQRFSANASKSKQATSRKKALEKIELDDMKPSSRKYPYIDFRPEREIGNEVLTVEGISKTIDGVKVLDNVSFIVNHDDKIAFVGSNELATTTLFNIITGNMEPDEGSYKWGVTTSQAYFPKDSAAEFNREDTIVEWLTQYSPDPDPTYVRGFLGRMLFAGDDGVKKVKVLSGGEKVRCLISKMMICGANVLVFDDPTNHLDMESITALNNGLIKFPGVTLFTSHDHQFIQTTANRIMEIVPSGQLIDKITTYDEYLASDEMARKRQGFAEAASDDED